ncbi:enoyl-CoA hydratase [Marinomonas agarivorans]|nr:enoyl-CoA hydratase [Marinomonas agarivorans]
MTHSKEIVVQHNKHVMHITINRPDKKNAFTTKMYDDLRVAIELANQDDEVNAILICGHESTFSAGNDLNDFHNHGPVGLSTATQLLTTIHSSEKPIVAAVSGVAIGVGATLLLHCDLVYAAPSTRFRMPFIDLGVCPEAGSSLLLPMLAGHRKASEILMLGDFFDTHTAIDIGLVTQEVPQDQVLTVAIQKAEQLAKKPKEALKITKQLMKSAQQHIVAEQMKKEGDLFGELLQSSQSKAIIATLLAS